MSELRPTPAKIAALRQRRDELSQHLARLRRERDLETREAAKIAQEETIRERAALLAEVEAELEPIELVEKADELERKQSWAAAIAAWEQLARLRPDDAEPAIEVARLRERERVEGRLRQVATGVMARRHELGELWGEIRASLQAMRSTGIPNDEALLLIGEMLDGRLDVERFSRDWYELHAAEASPAPLVYKTLAHRLRSGDLALFLGLEVAHDFDGQRPGGAELAGQLVLRADAGELGSSLAMVGEYYHLSEHGPSSLLRHLRELVPVATEVSLYRLLANVSAPLVVVSAGWDELLEDAFRAAGKPFAVVSPLVGKRGGAAELAVERSDIEGEQLVASEALSGLRLLDRYSLIYKPRGAIVPEGSGRERSAETLTLAERDLFAFARRQAALVPTYLARLLSERGLLILGLDARQWEERLLLDAVLDRRQGAEKPYAVRQTSDRFERAFWQEHAWRFEMGSPRFVDELAVHLRGANTSVSPYPGYRSFKTLESKFFFGRDTECSILTERIITHRLTLLIGASGVGKTSLLQAAVVPRLTDPKGKILGVVVCNDWTGDPLRALKNKLISAFQSSGRAMKNFDEMEIEKSTLVSLCEFHGSFTSSPLVLILDQFEQFLSLRHGLPDFGLHMHQIGALVSARTIPISVVLSVREKFAPELSGLGSFVQSLLVENTFRLERLSIEDSRRAIESPAKVAGFRYEPELIEALLADLKDNKGQNSYEVEFGPEEDSIEPRFLQIACSELWEVEKHCQDRVLRLLAYQRCGRFAGLLKSYMRRVFDDNGVFENQLKDLAPAVHGHVERKPVAVGCAPNETQEVKNTENPTPKAPRLFYSYAHEDEPLRDQLAKHLKLLERQGILSSWHDRSIAPGTDWDKEISQQLLDADIILLLVSADFLASDYIDSKELQVALDRQERGEARVIPIILRPCDWTHAPFAHLQALPRDGRALTTWPNRDQAFTNIAKALRGLVHP